MADENRINKAAAEFCEQAERAFAIYHDALRAFDGFGLAGDYERASREITNASAALESYLGEILKAWQSMGLNDGR